MRKYLKLLSIIIGVIGYIGGLLHALQINDIFQLETYDLTISIYITYVIITSLIIVVLLSIGERLSNQEKLYDLLNSIKNNMNQQPTEHATEIIPEHIWLCEKCGIRNHKTYNECTNCGTQRKSDAKIFTV